MNIGKLESVPVRKLWPHEQYDFSAWLSQEENLDILGETLGIAFTDIETEKYVGAYRCDIVAVDDNTGKTVIVENQLEPSNHDHLGKIITYASGLNANVVIWIVTNARSEHKSAVEWLNHNTVNGIDFFLIELKAYRIGDSLPAPKFEIAEMPNGFNKSFRNGTSNKELNKSQAGCYDFWTRFIEFSGNSAYPILKNRTAGTDNWMDVSMGSGKFHMAVRLNNQNHYVDILLHINDDKDIFKALKAVKGDIEAEFGQPLEWRNSETMKKSEIVYTVPGLDFDDTRNYDELMGTALDSLIALKEIFTKYITDMGCVNRG